MAKENGTDEQVVVFTHGGWIQYFMKNVHKNPHKYSLIDFDPSKAITIHKNTAMSRFKIERDGCDKPILRFHFVNDASHLILVND